MDAGALRGSEGELCELRFGKGELGPADDDPLGQSEQVVGRAPLAQGEEAVGAGEDKEGCPGIFAGERGEGIDGVVGLAVGARGIQGGDEEVARGGLTVAKGRVQGARGAVMARRSAKEAVERLDLSGWMPTGAKRTRSRAKASAAAEASRRWPRWMGSKVPPKKATRILTMLEHLPGQGGAAEPAARNSCRQEPRRPGVPGQKTVGTMPGSLAGRRFSKGGDRQGLKVESAAWSPPPFPGDSLKGGRAGTRAAGRSG